MVKIKSTVKECGMPWKENQESGNSVKRNE